MNILIVIPMKEEFEFFLKSFHNLGYKTEDFTVGKLSVKIIPELNVTLARGGFGKVKFAVKTQHLLDAYTRWDLVICAGTAGALIDDVSAGDVVVATATIEHDFCNTSGKACLPKFEGNDAVISGLRGVSLPAGTAFKIHFGIIASGDEVVLEKRRRSSLHKLTGALVVDLEGAGGARACRFSDVPFVEIRGATDNADHHTLEDFETNLEIAMDNVAKLITSWIKPGVRKEKDSR